MRLVMQIDGEPEPVTLPGDGRDLIAFLSFAAMRGFGAQHALIALADRLHGEHAVRMGPLTTFYDGTIEDAEDAEKIEHAWQPAGPLRAALEQVATAMDSDPQAQTLARRGGAAGIGEQARALLAPLDRAAAAGRRVRLVYEL
ncbi:MAG: hypothetical protein WD557_05545 [Dehalococcoidia bacterium]